MKSPFPGMDPYLESKWPEVHARLIVYAANQINAQLPADLQANIEENLAVYEEDGQSHSIRPDLQLVDDGQGMQSTAGSSQVAVAEPLRVKKAPHPTRHIKIVNPAGRVITAIEFVSPWNKIGTLAREQYVRKQLDYLQAGINLVEIDLVHRGKYVLAAPLDDVFPEQMTPYWVCVSRMIRPDEVELYRVPIDKPLPNIPIPLRPNERDVVLQLQLLLDDAYRDGRYHRINYQVDPRSKFDDETARWIDQRLRGLGLRS